MILLALVLAACICLYALPSIVSAVIHAVPPARLLGRREADREFPTRVRAVGTFLSGLADGISGYDPAKRRRYRLLTGYEKPFYVEGACTGLRLCRYMAPWRAIRNLTKFSQQHQNHLFLLTIGAGFACGLETFWSSTLTRRAQESSKQVDARLRQMFFDGFAFQKVIFQYLNRPAMLVAGLQLEPMARRGFYEGVGRALWFLAPGFSGLQAAIAALPAGCIAECHVGYGIASGFAGIELLAEAEASQRPPAHMASADFQTGLMVGLFGRYYTDPAYVEQLLAGRHAQLLDEVKRTAVLFDELWRQNLGYAEWRDALKLQLARHEAGAAYLKQPAASTV